MNLGAIINIILTQNSKYNKNDILKVSVRLNFSKVYHFVALELRITAVIDSK
jgi:hypothetical protein